MRTEGFSFTGDQGMQLPAVLWLPEDTPKHLLQITHGMTEHMGRYEGLARALTDQGFAVAGFDLRGHGKNPGAPDCASFGDGGWEASINDMHLFFTLLHQRIPDTPHHMLGFSLGSFLLREYLGRHPSGVASAVILGTGWQPGIVLSLMQRIVKGEIRKSGFDATTPLVKKLSFETYNQKFQPNRTPSDWLCADEAELNAYRADSLCREHISAGLFWQLLCAMKRTGQADAYTDWHKETPVLLLSGLEDPVGNFGKGVQQVSRAMEKAGIQTVTTQLLPNARHDLLHEEASGAAEKARKLLIDWLQGH